MTPPWLFFTAITALLCAGFAQLFIMPILTAAGTFRVIAPLSKEFKSKCTQFPEIRAQGCEKLSLHAETGLLYMACGNVEGRMRWMQGSAERLTGVDDISYLVMYDPSKPRSHAFQRVRLDGFDDPRTVAFHGMDVVPSSENSNEVFIYLVNHRMPIEGTPKELGTYDSAIEVFKSTVGSNTAKHIHTFLRNDVLRLPNDVSGSPDGTSVYFTTNFDASVRDPNLVFLHQIVSPSMTVGFCHVDSGCKNALTGLSLPNGIVTNGNGTYYVASVLKQGYIVAERQEDDTLVYTETIPTEHLGDDNLTLDENGALWSAALLRLADIGKGMKNATFPSPSGAVRISINTGLDSFYGAKYNVENVVEDDGSFLSYITTIAHDSRRGKLYFHGLMTPFLTECTYP
ncbi:hypothetical protein CYLTODRAFT_399526 [Cylindrobasidium torrendii FP15055 ss-10]|uniref:Calcium-dependent phosphotriesterase n=1 Tax=Cylindrobasidium torrendii FP15055 ss-10 TaxID=1314674 RepID=A0A0D7B8X5_9AGAR|nr:hypothetical protein CYLTODRAFT_399526 [Cylindrobasidium torrendii FP15055 ss-10]